MPPKNSQSTYKFSNDDIMNASLMLQDAISNHLVKGIAEITQNVMKTKNKNDSAQYEHQTKMIVWQVKESLKPVITALWISACSVVVAALSVIFEVLK